MIQTSLWAILVGDVIILVVGIDMGRRWGRRRL